MTNTVLVLIDTKTLFCKRYVGKTCVLKVRIEEGGQLYAHEVEQIRMRPETIGVDDPEPETAA